ncbi:hypothetical protein HAX54_036387 [Datura stramonium]|uniref:C3H1-type domain-containing protein n=1 Tax=Datura stramonium TaxID=4076 RepID=A0ABS8SG09_DATST|nr:hypothetical protein [Datura stramonium]
MDSEQPYDVSDSDTEYDSDDSQEDPTFDILEETRSTLSKLSIEKDKSRDMSARRNVSKALEDCVEKGEQDLDKIVPELDDKDKKSYETVQEMIKAGQIEKLKVEQCKVYLRKHGLRLTGSKDTLIQRIKEHTDILDGRGEEKYPPSSFVLNCKGDACTGDVVMFEQNVYEMFSIASRSATGPPCGTRIVAGRIVKESYGAKKQQHTFTKWNDEAERQKILSEKHARGFVARSNRETRVQEKEMRQMRRENRVSTYYKEKKAVAESKGRMPHQRLKHTQGKQPHSLSMNSVNKKDQPQVEDERKECRNYTNVIQENVFPRENRPEERLNQRQPLTNMNLTDPSSYREQQGFGESYSFNTSKSPLRVHNSNTHMPMWRDSFYGGNTSINNNPLGKHNSNAQNIPTWRGYRNGGYNNCNTSRSPLRGHGHTYTYGHSQDMNYKSPQRTENWQARNDWCNAGASKRPFERKKHCRFYAQGRCYYGHSCRYLHDSVDI